MPCQPARGSGDLAVAKPIRLQTPLSEKDLSQLRAGDEVWLSGDIYTARDAAHRRMIECLDRGEPLPFELKGAVIYYAGPTPAPAGKVIGSVGPTTSGRMDAYAPRLIARGLKGMIGKGSRSAEVIAACREHHAIYFGAIGGAGALLARQVKAVELVAWEELGTEAVRRLKVEDFPLVVVNDGHGGDLYLEARRQYQRSGS